MISAVEPATARDGFAITPSDATVYAPRFDAVYVGTTGNLTIRSVRGNDVLFANVPAGAIIDMAGDMVKATGTTASDITGMNY